MTKPTTLAETILRDVPRYWQASNRSLQPATDGEWLSRADVLAALTAAMDPAIAERAGELARSDDPKVMLYHGEYVEALRALLAQNAALRAERDAQRRDLEKMIRNQRAELRRLQALERVHWQSVERWKGTREGLEGKVKAAETEAEKLRGALTNLPAVYAHQINTGVREVYDPLQRFYTMESVLAALATEADDDRQA